MMNKIQQLIAEHCHNGVEFKKLGEVCEFQRGVRVVRSQLTERGKYPVFQNSMKPLGYFDNKNCSADTTFIISGGAAGEVGYSNVDFWAADDCFYFICSEHLQSKFLYYALLCKQNYLFSQVRRASVPRLSRTVVENLEIPLPPLPVQHEIVAILDKFTELEVELEVELKAELEARKKQYEYYRCKLLTFNEMRGGG
jgi:restriction endonuclease S subunit